MYARSLQVFRKMASSLTESRYAEKLKIALFADENGVAFMKQFLDDPQQQVSLLNFSDPAFCDLLRSIIAAHTGAVLHRRR